MIVGIESVFCSQRSSVETPEKYPPVLALSRLCMTNTPFANPISLRIIRAARIITTTKPIFIAALILYGANMIHLLHSQATAEQLNEILEELTEYVKPAVDIV